MKRHDIQTDLECERFERILTNSASFKEQHKSNVLDLVAWNGAPSREKPLLSAAAVKIRKARPVL